MTHFPYDAVIFDLDGTIFDSKDCIIAAITTAMEEAGLPIPPDVDLSLLIGPPLPKALPALLHVPQDRVEEIIRRQRRAFYEQQIYHYAVFPGLRKILSTLHANGIYLAVATSRSANMTTMLMRLSHLDCYFDAIVSESDSIEKIGKTELIRRAIPENAGRIVMVGDRCFDMQGAAANAIDSIAAGYGYGSKAELDESGYTHYVTTPDELYTLLCGDTPPARGFFLSVEGPDGSGKSTLISLVTEKLRQYGFDLQITREPGGCSISEKIRNIILDRENTGMSAACEALLYAASRAEHVQDVIKPALKSGKFILSDRFVDSSVAYQGGARGLGVETVQAINSSAVAGCMPDATLYLSIAADDALSRRYAASTPDRLEMESLSFHKAVQTAYETIIRQDPERFIVVDAKLPPQALAADALEKILERVAPNQS